MNQNFNIIDQYLNKQGNVIIMFVKKLNLFIYISPKLNTIQPNIKYNIKYELNDKLFNDMYTINMNLKQELIKFFKNNFYIPYYSNELKFDNINYFKEYEHDIIYIDILKLSLGYAKYLNIQVKFEINKNKAEEKYYNILNIYLKNRVLKSLDIFDDNILYVINLDAKNRIFNLFSNVTLNNNELIYKNKPTLYEYDDLNIYKEKINISYIINDKLKFNFDVFYHKHNDNIYQCVKQKNIDIINEKSIESIYKKKSGYFNNYKFILVK